MPAKCIRGAIIEIARPCVVVQNDVSNAHSFTTIVAPITGAENVRRISPTHVLVRKGEGGLSKDSIILCEQIRTVDEKRFLRHCGLLTAAAMEKVDQALKISLGLSG